MDGRQTRFLTVALAAALAACSHRAVNFPSVIVLGIDGMDPSFLEAHWRDLPNLDRLRRDGQFLRLSTTMPPQSPVAWSTFITGLDPDAHGVFDFVGRDPRTLQPFSEIRPAGRAFWEELSAHGIPVTLLRMPMDYPPRARGGETLSGMGVPDMEGTYGTFTFFTADPLAVARELPGGRIVPVALENHRAVLHVRGPMNPYRHAPTGIEIAAAIDPDQPVARFTIGGSVIVLKQGEWSAWIPVRFPVLGPLQSAAGMIRLYARQLQPGFELYVSPVNFDPFDSETALSAPAAFSATLARGAGRYYTQGMPEDTAALRQHIFTRAEYLEQSALASREQIAVLKAGLDRFHGGFLFFHFYGVDQDSHMLWGRFDTDLLRTYQLADSMAGMVRARQPRATLIVMSDHGFTRFTRAVNLNTWLLSEGLLRTDPATGQIDWLHTRAYSLGLNALYLNRAGRELHGIVTTVEAPALLARIARSLEDYRDPDTAAPVVTRTDAPHNPSGPDLIVGFAAGYRASWDGAMGKVERAIVEDNTDEWIGDHCMSPEVVPGVLLSTLSTATPGPALRDLAPSILGLYRVPAPPAMKGRELFQPAPLKAADP